MRAEPRRVRRLLAWTLSAAALAAGAADGATGEDPYFPAAQQKTAELTAISAVVGPTGTISYRFVGYHPSISGAIFSGSGAFDPKTGKASERLDFPRGSISSTTTCDIDPWTGGAQCQEGKIAASSGAPVDITLLPYGTPVGAQLFSPASNAKAKAASIEAFRNRPTATPTRTPVPRFALRSGGREVLLPTPTPAGHLARVGAPAGVAGLVALNTPTQTPTRTPTRTPTHAAMLAIVAQTPTPTHTPVASGGPPGRGPGTTARLPLPAVAAFLNDALQGTRIRLHNAAPGGGYANDSYVSPGPQLGGGRIPIGIPAPTIQAGAFTSTLFVNDVNSVGVSAALVGDRFLVTFTFESAGPELLVRGPVPLDVEADNGRLLLTLTPGLDASGRPSFATLDVDLTANVRCTAPNQSFLAGICNSVEPAAVGFLRNQAGQGLRQALGTPDFRGRIGAALRALLDAPAGKASIERATGQRIGTIRATRFEANVLAIDHD